MHSHSEAKPHRDGQYRCSYTKALFPYVYSSDGSTRRAAERELKNHQTKYIEAAEARAGGRKLSVRELLKGGAAVPDLRSRSERISDDATVSVSRATDPDANPLAPRLAELRAALVALPATGYGVAAKRAAIERRIASIAPQVDAKAAEIQTRKDREAMMSSVPVQDAVLYGQAWLDRIQMRPDVPQAWIAGCRERLEALKRTGDVESFWKSNDAFEAERQATLDARLATLNDDAASVRAEAAEVRRDKRADVVAPSGEAAE